MRTTVSSQLREVPRPRIWRPEMRVGLALVLALVLFGGSMLKAAPALAYSCGDASSGHCYAESDGDNYPSGFRGAKVQIYVVHLQCNQCGGINTTTGFIDNEMWLDDSAYAHWVEAGYWTQSNPFQTVEDYFWADKRPRDCSTCVNVHDLGGVASGDYGHNTDFLIWQDTNPDEFAVQIAGYSSGINGGTSTDNSMNVGHVLMGQELAGNAGASAPQARYSYRFYMDGNFNFVAQNGYYSLSTSDPPYAGYVSGDTDFYTYCC